MHATPDLPEEVRLPAKELLVAELPGSGRRHCRRPRQSCRIAPRRGPFSASAILLAHTCCLVPGIRAQFAEPIEIQLPHERGKVVVFEVVRDHGAGKRHRVVDDKRVSIHPPASNVSRTVINHLVCLAKKPGVGISAALLPPTRRSAHAVRRCPVGHRRCLTCRERTTALNRRQRRCGAVRRIHHYPSGRGQDRRRLRRVGRRPPGLPDEPSHSCRDQCF
mmetsp:Transcript_30132/g.87770  ORF Transcript_30132/g.87770 Transcript_30132/m.87770 type:complete len:220 (-) Transcript_30132:95-754(-)